MKLLDRTLQLIIKEELDNEAVKEMDLDGCLLYIGPGHTVIDADKIARNGKKETIDGFLSDLDKSKFYYRLSFVENLKEPSSSSRCYMTHEGNFFKPRVSGDLLYFLGLKFVIVELTANKQSKNFKINNYCCTIKMITVEAKTGEIEEEILWEKSKFGRIENYLPNKLKDYTIPIAQCRRRLSNVN